MERTTIDLWFGAFVTAGFAALLVLALKVGNLGAERADKTYRVEARFDNIGGLKVRAPVRSAGVLVGRVADIHFDNAHYQADVTLALDQRYKFPKDTTASILTSGLLGESYVGLDAGGDEKSLGPGDRIPITQSAVVLEKLIGQFLFSKAQEEPAGGAKKLPEPPGAAK
jgi:phospholipid/cholesterol/gamma-HCH transport system substrate-binding protein